jgi:alginate O-acetyltransferase complex protein AlgI
MLFNSLSFVAFFLIFYLLFLSFPQKHKWKIFLFGSWVFYAAFEPVYLFLLFFITAVDFWSGQEIYRAGRTKRKYLLLLALSANIGLLFAFKYVGFSYCPLAYLSTHSRG